MKDQIEDVIFYSVDHVYWKKQQFAHNKFVEQGLPVTPEQWVILKILHQYEGLSQVELAERAAKDTASITRILDILQKKGLLERRPSAGDRRRYSIHPTHAGKQLINDNLEFVIGLRKQAVKGISKTELDLLRSLLEKMRTNME